MTRRKKIDTLTTTAEHETLRRLANFAQRNNLELFNVKGSLYDRVKIITNGNDACPCFPNERRHCPCPQAIKECAEHGECACRVFMAQKKG